MWTSFLFVALTSPYQDLGPRSADQLQTDLRQLAAAHAQVASHLVIGTSLGGRPLEGLSIASPGLPEFAPTVLVVGGVEGPRAFEGSVVLDHARRLCEERPALLEVARVICIPRVSLDAAESRFETPVAESFASFHDADTDRDGLFGEDPPADVNGDGLVTWMRVPDLEGQHIADPHDERANVKADAQLGQRGAFRVVPEGFDADGDEQAAEDGPLDGRVDRGFSAGWEEHEPHAARFPLEDSGAKALADFMIEHPEITMVLVYGDADNLGAAPKGTGNSGGRVPSSGWMNGDAEWLKALGETWRDGLEKGALPKPAAHAPEPGSFASWAYEHRGLWVVAGRLWDLPQSAPKPAKEDPAEDAPMEDGPAEAEAEADSEAAGSEAPSESGEDAADEPAQQKQADQPPGEPSEQAKELEWIDATEQNWRFVPWQPFDHPQLGAVEIGGFAPFARFDPPEDQRESIAAKRYEFLTGLEAWLPRLAISSLEVEAKGTGLFEVRAHVTNEGRLPVLPEAGVRAEHRPRVIVELQVPDGAVLVAGNPRQTFGNLSGEGGRREFVWLLAADSIAGLTVRASAPHLGSVTQEVAQ